MNEQIINKEKDDLIIKNANLIYFTQETILNLKKKYNFTNSIINIKDKNNYVNKFKIGLIYFNNSINIDGFNTKCLIQATTHYNDHIFNRLFNQYFYYGNISGIGYIDNDYYNEDDIQLMSYFNLE